MAERVHYLNLGPFPGHVGFTTSPGAYAREMKRMAVKEPDGFVKNAHSHATTHFFTSSDGERTTIVCMPPHTRSRSKEQYAALLAHEATHVVQDMRDRLGNVGEEAEAYLVQQIVQEGLQIAWKTGRQTRRKPCS